MRMIILIGLTLLVILSGCACEYRTLNTGEQKQCAEFCKGKNMTRYDYTGTQDYYLNCVCYEIILKAQAEET